MSPINDNGYIDLTEPTEERFLREAKKSFNITWELRDVSGNEGMKEVRCELRELIRMRHYTYSFVVPLIAFQDRFSQRFILERTVTGILRAIHDDMENELK